jgi:hypothetical protein
VIPIGGLARDWIVSEWVQGTPVTLDHLHGKVVLIEVFQVNCPGCFLYGLPEAIEAHAHFPASDFAVIGIATAFEDFELNSSDNLRLLLETGEVIGETKRVLMERDWLTDGRLRYKIPFPVATDKLAKPATDGLENRLEDIIRRDITNFDRFSYGEQARIRDRIRTFMLEREWVPQTFDRYGLHGTPTSLLIDRNGILRYNVFGADGHMMARIRELLLEH